ncbi:AbrB/MazE/SpoVT family DNA-binding domain-containing protein [Thermus sp.]|uniref:AbrB/MazE/SpoVT family DNA-binding domain-containing protein n=1 Tax=Thermus sp. TaxID=275 RepID=UPI00307F7BF2
MLSRRSQLTLPKEVRERPGLEAGDVLLRVEGGKIVLEPALLLSYEMYTEEHLEDFQKTAEVSPEELAEFRRAWDLE